MTRSRSDRMMSGVPAPPVASGRGRKFTGDPGILEASPVAGPWLDHLRELLGSEAMDRGLEAARSGSVSRVDVEASRVAGHVRSEAGDKRRVSILSKPIEELVCS